MACLVEDRSVLPSGERRPTVSVLHSLRWCYDRSMLSCEWCGTSFVASGRRRFCSDACKQATWRARHAVASPARPEVVRPDATIYECPSCEQRYLGSRRCEDCNSFCRRIGPGALCPNCDVPFAFEDLAI